MEKIVAMLMRDKEHTVPKKNDRNPDLFLQARDLLRQLPTTPLSPRQVEAMTGLSVDQLKERRRARPPKPPLAYLPVDGKPGSAVWYPLGEVLEFLRDLLPPGSRVVISNQILTFGEFLDRARPSDSWPMARLRTGLNRPGFPGDSIS